MTQNQIKMLLYSFISTVICCLIYMIYFILFRKGKKIHLEDIVLASLLTIISSLRYGVGSDYFRYLESAQVWASKFSSNPKLLLSIDVLQEYSFEVGYKLLSVLASKLSDSPYTIFWLISIVIYVPIVVYCRKFTTNASIAVAVFLLFGFWGFSLNVIGQCVAMVFLLYAEKALEYKKIFAFIILTLCAEAFHTTAILAVIVILIVHTGILNFILKPTRRNLILMVGIGIILRGMVEAFSVLVSRFSFLQKYSGYLSTDASGQLSRLYMMIGTAIQCILVVGILYGAIIMLPRFPNRKQSFSTTISIVMMGVPFCILGISRAEWMWLASRFAEYFFLFLIALIPEILDSECHDEWMRITAKDQCLTYMEQQKYHTVLTIHQKRIPIFVVMIVWHAIFAIAKFNNNMFEIGTYLFR